MKRAQKITGKGKTVKTLIDDSKKSIKNFEGKIQILLEEESYFKEILKNVDDEEKIKSLYKYSADRFALIAEKKEKKSVLTAIEKIIYNYLDQIIFIDDRHYLFIEDKKDKYYNFKENNETFKNMANEGLPLIKGSLSDLNEKKNSQNEKLKQNQKRSTELDKNGIIVQDINNFIYLSRESIVKDFLIDKIKEESTVITLINNFYNKIIQAFNFFEGYLNEIKRNKKEILELYRVMFFTR